MFGMMPGVGMGSAGTGMGAGPQMSMTPQILAALAAMRGGGQPFAAPPGPLQAPPTGTPMAGYLGMTGGGGGMGGMRPGAAALPPAPGSIPPAAGAAPATGSGMDPQLMKLLQMLKGQQSGIAPPGAPGGGPGGIPGGTGDPSVPNGSMMGPGGGAPAAMPNPFQGAAMPGQTTPAVSPDMWQRLLSMFGGGAAPS